MELLKGYESDVRVSVPKSLTTANYEVIVGGVTVASGNVTPDNGVATVAVPYGAVHEAGKAAVRFNFTTGGNSFTKTVNVEVNTPVLEIFEVHDVLEDGNDKEYRQVEAATRHIINAHCGQTFDFIKNETRVARGDGTTSLMLPGRALTVHEITGVPFQSYTLLDDGWKFNANVYDFYDHDYWQANGVIRLPGKNRNVHFRDAHEFRVRADWGWDSVPEAVREAARLLVNDYACGDSLYRDRYLTSMTAADWRIQFHAGAFAETGNVRADQLLQDYVVLGGWLAV